MTERSRTFGEVASAYERYRPGYPDALVDEVLTYAGVPVRTALEIGAGTGKATRVFAARGVTVTATDPDAAMLAELRRHVPASVQVVEAAFEQVVATRRHDLVYVAAALHWTRPEGRWERVAALLEPHGVFASFGGQLDLADPALVEAVREARTPFVDEDGYPSPDDTPADAPLAWPGTELVTTDLFDDVRQSVLEERSTMGADDYVGHLATISAYLVLSRDDRDQALRRIRAVLPDTVEVTRDLVLHLARRT